MLLLDIAHTDVVTVHPRDSIDKAIALMEEHQIHHLPVLTNDMPVGMISDRDILVSVGWLLSRERVSQDARPQVIGPQRVTDIMSSPIIALPPGAGVAEAGELMLERRIHAVAVVSGDRLLGIVTETDLLRCFIDDRFAALGGGWKHERVAQHFTARVECLGAHQMLAAAARLMHEKDLRHVPVVDGHQLRGMITDRDVRRAVGRHTIEETMEAERWSPSLFGAKLGDIMTQPVQTIGPRAALAESADRMMNLGIGALPVVEDDLLVGMQTETDLLRVLVAACI